MEELLLCYAGNIKRREDVYQCFGVSENQLRANAKMSKELGIEYVGIDATLDEIDRDFISLAENGTEDEVNAMIRRAAERAAVDVGIELVD